MNSLEQASTVDAPLRHSCHHLQVPCCLTAECVGQQHGNSWIHCGILGYVPTSLCCSTFQHSVCCAPVHTQHMLVHSHQKQLPCRRWRKPSTCCLMPWTSCQGYGALMHLLALVMLSPNNDACSSCSCGSIAVPAHTPQSTGHCSCRTLDLHCLPVQTKSCMHASYTQIVLHCHASWPRTLWLNQHRNSLYRFFESH